ncbi:MAG: ABC transporter transmembrane domain-containing protein, partial [Vicinamibacterales bacterium]
MKAFRTLRRFLAAVVAASPRQALAGALVMLSLALTEGLGLLLLIPLLQLVGVDASEGSLNRIAAALAGAFGWLGVRPTLGVVLTVYVGIIALHTLLGRWHTMLSAAVQHDTVAMLRMRLYRLIARTEWVFFVRNRQSDFVHALTGEIDRVGAAAYYLVELSVAALVLLVYLGLALRVSPETTLLVLLCGAALAWAGRGRLKDSHDFGEQTSLLRKKLYAAMAEHLGSMKAAKSQDTEDRHAEVFVAVSRELRDLGLRMTDHYAKLRQQTQLASAVVLAVIVYVARELLALPTAQ